MRSLVSIALIAFFLFLGESPVLAQKRAPQPPPPVAPDYNPKLWKEYSFADDNIRFRFPVKPKLKESTRGTEKATAHIYSRQSFMLLQLTVILHPVEQDLESYKDALDAGIRGGLDNVKDLEPKIITQEDVLVDGHSAKFLKVETNNGLIMRWKIFAVKNKIYTAVAISKKGERHGVNWENDFEIPAMAFLDSLHVIPTK